MRSHDYLMPHDEIARDIAGGKKVVVFCDSADMAKAHMDKVSAELRGMGHGRSEQRLSYRHRTIRIDGAGIAHFVLTDRNCYHGRGLAADEVYLSESARMQAAQAHVMTMRGRREPTIR